jgi:transposase-like protein
MASVLDSKHFRDEAAAYKWVEARVWPKGRVCPHCGVVDDSAALKGKSTRIGVYKCYSCRKPFTVKVGTIFEKSHIPMRIWLQAMFLLASSKKGISSNQLSRTLGVTLKSAWFMSHRIREAMREGSLAPPKMGGGGTPVEVDETFYTKTHVPTGKTGTHSMGKVLSLLDRESGEVRSFVIPDLQYSTIGPILRENIAREARLMTDEASWYYFADRDFPAHESVKHREEEYVRGDVSTNAIEGFYSIFKRGMRGVYQHCESKHLHRYAGEFDFRYTHRIRMGVDDEARFAKLVAGVSGKRLTYQTARKRPETRAW